MTVPKPILKVKGEINHKLIEKIFSGESGIKELNDDDARVLEQAIYEKFRTQQEKIMKGLVNDEHYEYKKGEIGFHLTLGSFGSIFLNLSVAPNYESWNHKRDDEPNSRIKLYFKNNVDYGNGYGHATPDISRIYKLTRIKQALPKIEAILDKFVKIVDKQRPIFLQELEDNKKDEARDIRVTNQEKFRKIHDHYSKLKSLAVEYGVDHRDLTNISDLIIKRGKTELKKLKESGTEYWFPEDAEDYKDFGMFA